MTIAVLYLRVQGWLGSVQAERTMRQEEAAEAVTLVGVQLKLDVDSVFWALGQVRSVLDT